MCSGCTWFRTQPRPASSRPMTAQSESRGTFNAFHLLWIFRSWAPSPSLKGTGLDKCPFGSKKARRHHVGVQEFTPSRGRGAPSLAEGQLILQQVSKVRDVSQKKRSQKRICERTVWGILKSGCESILAGQEAAASSRRGFGGAVVHPCPPFSKSMTCLIPAWTRPRTVPAAAWLVCSGLRPPEAQLW